MIVQSVLLDGQEVHVLNVILDIAGMLAKYVFLVIILTVHFAYLAHLFMLNASHALFQPLVHLAPSAMMLLRIVELAQLDTIQIQIQEA